MTYSPVQLLRISSRLCLECGSPIEPDRAVLTCAACSLKRTNADRERRAARLLLAQCGDCGAPVTSQRHRCATCLRRQKVRITALRVARVAAGLCGRCGKASPLPALVGKDDPLCESCWYRRIARHRLGTSVHWRVLRDKFAAQEGRCAYSGDQLTLGINASLDHILPVSRFPEKQFDPSNVEWVADWVNLMKWDATPDEFIDRLRRVLVYRSW